MAHFSDSAVVLRRLDYSESSQIVTLLSRDHGKLSLIAKGIKRGTKKRFAAGLDLLEVGQVVWTARPDRQQNLVTLTEWRQRQVFGGLREDLQRLYCAQYGAEITAELTHENDHHDGLFDAMVHFLEGAEQAADPLGEVCAYQRNLLVVVGLFPQSEHCVGCTRNFSEVDAQRLHFSSHEGGFICRDCENHYVEKRLVDGTVLDAVAGKAVGGCPATSLFDVFNYHISHLIGKEPKLAEFVLPAIRRRQL